MNDVDHNASHHPIGKYTGIHQWIIRLVIVWNDLEAICGFLLPVIDSNIAGPVEMLN